MTQKLLENIVNTIKDIDKLCVPSIDIANEYSYLLKDIYDTSVEILFRARNKKLGPLSQFFIIGLDEESIWEELQTRNKPLLRYISKATSKLWKKFNKEESKEYESNNDDIDENIDDINDNLAKTSQFENDSTSVSDEVEAEVDDGDYDSNNDDEYNSDDDIGGNDDIEDNEIQSEARISDDKNEFELSEMEAWLDKEEELEEKRIHKLEKLQKKIEKNQNLEESDSEDEELDDMFFVQENLYEMNDDDDVNDYNYRYSDFFATKKGSSSSSTKSKKYISRADEEEDEEEEEDSYIDMEEEDDDDDYEEEYDDDDEEHDKHYNHQSQAGVHNDSAVAEMTVKNNKNQLLMRQQIGELEKDLVAPKPWELRGEVKASQRPENSFLSLSADIERTSKPAPVVTQEFTSSLEDLIRKRIKEGNFNDVKLKEISKPKEINAVDVSQEKSKLGLGEIYAEEFLAKSLNSQPEVVSKRLEANREELQNLFHKVSRQLDALSHFHFTPRPIVSDTKITSLPVLSSILLEDVTPVGLFSNNSGMEQSMLAPEEVFNKKRGKAASLMSANELTAEDKKRIRKASKSANKAAKKHTDLSVDSDGVKARKDDKALENTLKRDSRVILANDSSSQILAYGSKKAKSEQHMGGRLSATSSSSISYAKSESFFANLQKQTENQIKDTLTDSKNYSKNNSSKNTKNQLSSSLSIKL